MGITCNTILRETEPEDRTGVEMFQTFTFFPVLAVVALAAIIPADEVVPTAAAPDEPAPSRANTPTMGSLEIFEKNIET